MCETDQSKLYPAAERSIQGKRRSEGRGKGCLMKGKRIIVRAAEMVP